MLSTSSFFPNTNYNKRIHSVTKISYSCFSDIDIQIFTILQDPLRFLLAASTGTLFLVALIVLRIYLVKFFNCRTIFLVNLFKFFQQYEKNKKEYLCIDGLEDLDAYLFCVYPQQCICLTAKLEFSKEKQRLDSHSPLKVCHI